MIAKMKRRDFVALLGGAAAAWPLAAGAQQPMPVVGFLDSRSPGMAADTLLAAFRQGLAQTGFVEGRDVAIEYHFAGPQSDRLSALVADLIRRQVAAIAGVPTTRGVLGGYAGPT